MWELNILPPYRKAHVSELFDETVHDPRLIWLVAHLPLKRHMQNIEIFNSNYISMTSLTSTTILFDKSQVHSLTLLGPFLGPLPQELQEELLSWEVGLFHMSPSSVSHWPVDMPMSSPPLPQPSCIGLGPERERWSNIKDRMKMTEILRSNNTKNAVGYLLVFSYLSCILHAHWEYTSHFRGWAGGNFQPDHLVPLLPFGMLQFSPTPPTTISNISNQQHK